MRIALTVLLASGLAACGSEGSPASPAVASDSGLDRASGGSTGSGGGAGSGGTGGNASADGGSRDGSTVRGNRTLGMHIAEGMNEEYFAALSSAQALGVEVADIAMPWGSVQTSCAPAAYDPVFVGYLDALSSFPALGMKVGFVILGPINTNVKEVPAELLARPLDDPATIACFNGFTDFVLGKLATVSLHSFAIGNEIDAWLGSDAGRWAEYGNFYRATREHVKGRRPDLPVGTVGTLDGQIGAQRQRFVELNRDSDVILFTTYGLGDGYAVKPASSVDTEWDALLAQYPGKRVHAQEAGHPSSALCRSSEAQQADYFSSVFRVWDRNAERLDTVYIAFLTDWDPAGIDEIASYYGVADPAFKGFLGSLGIRRYDTTPKAAYARIRDEASTRGW